MPARLSRSRTMGACSSRYLGGDLDLTFHPGKLPLLNRIPAAVRVPEAILSEGAFRDGQRLAGPSSDGGGIEARGRPGFAVLVLDLASERRRDGRLVATDLFLDDAHIPGEVQADGASAGGLDEIGALVVLERDMERLMNVGHPMPEALEQPQAFAGILWRGKIARVVQDRGGDAAVSRGAEVGGFDSPGATGDVKEMLGRRTAGNMSGQVQLVAKVRNFGSSAISASTLALAAGVSSR